MWWSDGFFIREDWQLQEKLIFLWMIGEKLQVTENVTDLLSVTKCFSPGVQIAEADWHGKAMAKFLGAEKG